MMFFAWWRQRKTRRERQRRRVAAVERKLRLAEVEHAEAADLAAELRQRYRENRFAPMLVEAFRGQR